MANGNAAVYNYDAVGNILSIARYASTQASVFSFAPKQGSAGTQVTIYGTGFSTTPNQNTVQFGGAGANVISASSNQLLVAVPDAAITGPISVTSPAGSATSSSNFTVVPPTGAPTILGFTPAIAMPGAAVTISGTNFDPNLLNDRIRFNSSAALPTAATPTSIATAAPPTVTSGHVTVATTAGTAVSTQDLFVPFLTHVVADVAYTGRGGFASSQTVALPAGKIGLLLFDATAGQRVSLNLTNSTYLTSCSLYLFAPDGSQMLRWSCGTTSVDNTLLPLTGTYTIGLETQTNGGGSVTIGINNVSDVTGSIVIDGPPVTVTTAVPRQDARLTFSAAANQRIFIQATNVTNPLAALRVVKPDGELMTASTTLSNNPAGQLFFIDTQSVITNGTYSLWVQHNSTNVGSETLQIFSVPPDFTVPITLGGPPVRVPTSGNTAIGQNAQLTFNANAGQRLSLNISNATYTPGTSCTLQVRGPNTTFTGTYCGSGASPFVDTMILSNAGAYTIFIDPQIVATGTTTVTANDASDVTGSITIDGPTVTATTSVPGQDARISFAATAGQRVVLLATNVSNPNATVKVLKPDGSTQATFGINNNLTGQTFFLDTQTLPVTGTYTLWIQHVSSNIGSETLQLSSVPADYTAAIAIGDTARVPASGNTAIGQNATLTFSANAGQKVSISVSNATYSAFNSCFLGVFAPNGSRVTSAYCGNGAPFIDTFTLNTTGTYSIILDPSGTAVGTTTITLNNAADASGAITIDGPPVTATTTSLGQDARLTFSAAAGQRIVVQASNVTNPQAVLNLVRPDGTTQTTMSIANSPTGFVFFMDTQVLATAGNYTLWIRHSGTNIGSETLTLNGVPADFTGALTINGAAARVPSAGNTAMGQNAALTFTAAAGQSLKINMSNSTYSPVSACAISLKNPAGNNVFASANCGTGASSPISTSAATAGTYTILIDPQGAATGTITVSVTSP